MLQKYATEITEIAEILQIFLHKTIPAHPKT